MHGRLEAHRASFDSTERSAQRASAAAKNRSTSAFIRR